MPKKLKSLEQELRALRHKFAEIETAYSRLERDFQQIDTLYTVVSDLSPVIDLAQLTVRTKRLFKKIIPADLFALCLVDTHKDQVQSLCHFGTPRAWTKRTRDLQKGTAFYDAIKERKPVLVKANLNGAVDFAEYTLLDRLRGDFLVLPLLAQGGKKVIGLLTLLRRAQDGFRASDVKLIKTVATQVSQILSKVLLFEKTRALSITDELTGVFNRRYFRQRFEQENLRAKRYGHHLSILMLDIDNFKIYNDRNGHLMGDKVLVKVARLLENNLRKSDMVARYGGEEFMIMLPEITKEQAKKVANKLRLKIHKETFPKEETQPQHRLTISIGLASFPEDGQRVETLLKYADQALYTAKSLGRNRIAWKELQPPRP